MGEIDVPGSRVKCVVLDKEKYELGNQILTDMAGLRARRQLAEKDYLLSFTVYADTELEIFTIRSSMTRELGVGVYVFALFKNVKAFEAELAKQGIVDVHVSGTVTTIGDPVMGTKMVLKPVPVTSAASPLAASLAHLIAALAVVGLASALA